MPFKLNVNAGMDTLHIEQPGEQCNTDDAEGMEEVDDATAHFLLSSGQAKVCQHCEPKVP